MKNVTPMRKVVICDLDGTLADITHRMHHIKNDAGIKDWDEFFNWCHKDKPIQPIIDLVNLLSARYDVVIMTGRSNVVKDKTFAWLNKHGVKYSMLMMRQAGDHRPDDEVKETMYLAMKREVIGVDIGFVLEDRSRVVEMWRSHELTCLQVAEGNF